MTRFRFLPLLIFFLSALFSPPSPAQEVRIHADFPNGSLGGWRQAESGEVILSHATGSAGLWFHFRVENAQDRPLRFVFPKVRNDYFGGANLPVYSYNQTHWSYVSQRTITPLPDDSSHVRFSFQLTPAQNRVWLAFSPPYDANRLNRLLQTAGASGHATASVIAAAPVSGRALPVLRIPAQPLDPAPQQRVLVLAREDAYETASSYLAEGMVRFLISDDPIAQALRRRAHFFFMPLLDADGVEQGYAVHPFDWHPEGVFWTETWPETLYSFYEQRQTKRYLQRLFERGEKLTHAFRLHSEAWSRDRLRREHAAEVAHATQDALFLTQLGERFLPWYENADRTQPDTRFSKVVIDRFPNAITGLVQSDWVFPNNLVPAYPLYKTTGDLMVEGELFMRALAEEMGLSASDHPPFLHAARLAPLSQGLSKFAAQCVYRDLNGRPPAYVRVVVNETPYDLEPLQPVTDEAAYQQGVLYGGFIEVQGRDHVHHFAASNGSREVRVPRQGNRPGPYWLSAPATPESPDEP